MRAAIFNMSGDNENATTAGIRIGKFISRTLDLPHFHKKDIAEQKLDTLIIVAGSFAFCGARDELAIAIRNAGEVIWVENDYTIKVPSINSKAESPFRKVWRDRQLIPHYWTTIRENSILTAKSRYVNWNSLTYEPIPVVFHKNKNVIYFGSFRSGRQRVFDKYFSHPCVPTIISQATSKFSEKYSHQLLTFLPRLERPTLSRTLSRYGFGLYLQDSKNDGKDYSPPNRFYEMLAAGLPMLFDEAAVNSAKLSGIEAKEFCVSSSKDFIKFLPYRNMIARKQADMWRNDYKGILTKRIKEIWEEHVTNTRTTVLHKRKT